MKGYYELKFEEFFSHLDGGLRVSCNDARPAEDKESGTKVGRTLRGHEALGTGAYKLSDMDGREFAPHMEYCNLKKMLSLVEVSWTLESVLMRIPDGCAVSRQRPSARLNKLGVKNF
ncbi:hypothetical protein Tco_0498735 [Tanacetum coccineum]|uniref:Uncharacterized protein n=1 Tax=Tanacetum coccineum TaxID=301880 RepID=A0ABQ5EVC2_9ASTR